MGSTISPRNESVTSSTRNVETASSPPNPPVRHRSLRNVPRIDYRALASLNADEVTEPSTVKQAAKSHEWIQAMEMEITALAKNHIWALVDLQWGCKPGNMQVDF